MDSKRKKTFGVSDTEYPFADHWFERDGVALHYVDEGQGIPVVMLHGNPTWSFLYRNIIKELDGICRRIAPDYPGFGFSEHPPGYGYTPPEHAEWIRALIAHLDLDQFVLVVQDWGGPIGLSIAVEQPQKVAGLVICNTWCWSPSKGARIFSTIFGGLFAKYFHLRHNFFAKRLLPTGISRSESKKPEILKAYTDPFPTLQSRMGTYVFPQSIRKSAVWLETIERKLHVLKEKPVEMVWAMQDKAFGTEAFISRWQRHFPNTPVERIEDANHYLQEDRPDRVAAGIKRLLGRLYQS